MQIDLALTLTFLCVLAMLVFGVLPLLYVREWWRERGRSHVSRLSLIHI